MHIDRQTEGEIKSGVLGGCQDGGWHSGCQEMQTHGDSIKGRYGNGVTSAKINARE